MSAVHFVVPEGIDDPGRPSGGNRYDRELSRGLAAQGWDVHEHAVPGGWPRPDATALTALAGVLAGIPARAVVLLDGLVASAAPDVLVGQAGRLPMVVLVHTPLGHRPADEAVRHRERMALGTAAALITTSAWCRQRLLDLYGLPAERVSVAAPGAHVAQLAHTTAAGGRLLCVAAVTFEKGHDVLVDALQALGELSWQCVCVGSLDRDPGFVQEVRRRIHDPRISFAGVRSAASLDRVYCAADLLVLASRAETYGMVITEALARGVPVVATQVGGVAEALGVGERGVRPGLLIPAEHPAELAAALRLWLTDGALREQVRQAARERRQTLLDWSSTASAVAVALSAVTR